MSEIPQIGVKNINIPRIEAPGIYNYVPHTQVYPFILNIGSPVVNMPGCVKFHPDAADNSCLLYTSPSPRDNTGSRMPSSA